MESAKLNFFTFVGNKLPDNPKVGDVWFDEKTESLYAYSKTNPYLIQYCHNKELQYCHNEEYGEKQNRRYPTHCPSCGAPVNSSRVRCEYCGTEYREIL